MKVAILLLLCPIPASWLAPWRWKPASVWPPGSCWISTAKPTY